MQRTELDVDAYFAEVQSRACFICRIVAGEDRSHHLIYRDDVAIVFLSKYPTLYGYTLVCPLRHAEQVTADFSAAEYLALQHIVWRVGEAVRRAFPTERLYILSLGSQQANRHVHWHIAPLPPGVPLKQQQLAALDLSAGYLDLSDAQMQEIAAKISAELRS